MTQIVTKHSKTFLKLWRKVPKDIKKKAIEKEQLFRENQFHPKLKTHRLKGELKDFYSFSVDYHWRVLFHFENGGVVVFDIIGTHSVYK